MSARRLWIVATVLVAVAVAVVAVTVPRQSVDRTPVPTTFSADEEGCMALYLALEELRLPVERLRTDFTRLRGRDGVLVVVNPLQADVSKRETEQLKEWVEQGNRLVLFQARARAVEEDKKPKSGRGVRVSPRRSVPNDLPGVFGLSLRKTGDRSRKSLAVSFPGVKDAGPISVSGAARWKGAPEGWVTIARDDKGPVVVAGKVGRGSVAAVSDPTLVSNKFLPTEHNLRLVIALLLAETRPRTIFFGEHHHGYMISESFWTYMGSSVFLWVMVQALMGFALFFYSRRASYAGRYGDMTPERGRSSLEHVESMAGIFESCKASSVALAATVERFLVQLSRTTGVRLPRLDDPGFTRAVAGAPQVSPSLAALLEECRTVVRGPENPERSLYLARRLGAEEASAEAVRRKTLHRH